MNPKIHSPLHKLWTKAVGTPKYDKRERERLYQYVLDSSSSTRRK